jgi:serine/threonine-protein kinase
MQPPVYTAYPQAGEVIDGKYQIEKMLGEGGMGAVAKAIHLLRRAPVALKFMSPHFVAFPGAVDRFLNEGVAASQIVSDHVVQVYDLGKLPSGAPYMVMEYLEGKDLAELLQQEGRPGLPVDRAIHFVLQILRGLQNAHSAGIVHRDLKPSNAFIVTKDGERDFVKLLDFGISKVQQPGGGSLTQTGSALGTPLYMSPEQARSPKDVDARSDIYSVAVMLYELLTGRTPFFSESGEFTEILFKLFTADPPNIKEYRPDLPDGLAEAVHHAMARDRDQRTPSALALAEALAPYAGPQSDAVLQRIRSHVARRSQMPSNDALPSSAVAFERLGTGTAQQYGSQGRVQAASQAAYDSQGKVPASAQAAPVNLAPPPQSAIPPNPDTRARPEEAGAATQFDRDSHYDPLRVAIPKPPPVPGLATDMAASREAQAPAQQPKSRAPVFIGIAAAVALALAGTGVALNLKPSPAKPAPSLVVSAVPEAGPTTVILTTPTTPETVKSADVLSSTTDAGPEASAPKTPPTNTAKTPATNTATTRPCDPLDPNCTR